MQNNFFEHDTETANDKRKIDKIFYIKIKNFFLLKDIIKESEKANYTLGKDIHNSHNLHSASIQNV